MMEENHALMAELASLKQQLLDARRTSSAQGGKRSSRSSADELRSLDKLVMQAKRENVEMRDALESHAGELEVHQRMQNIAADRKARLDKQNEENMLLERVNSRQAEQLSQLGLSAAQKGEMERLKSERAEVNESLRAMQQRSAELARQQHAAQLQWSKTCARSSKLKRELVDHGGASGAHEGEGAAAADKTEARLENATKALKLAVHAGEAQGKRQQQRMASVVAELQALRQQTEALSARIVAEGGASGAVIPLPAEAEIHALGRVAAYVPCEPFPEPLAPSVAADAPPSRLEPTPPAGARLGKPRGRGGAPAAAAAPAIDAKQLEQQAAAVALQASVRGRRARTLARSRAEAKAEAAAAAAAEAAAAEAAAAAKSALNPFGMGGKKNKRSLLGGGAIGGAMPAPAAVASAPFKPAVEPFKPAIDATAPVAPTLTAAKPQFATSIGKPPDSRPFHIVPQAAASPSDELSPQAPAPAPAAAVEAPSAVPSRAAAPASTPRASILDDLDDLGIADGMPVPSKPGKAAGGFVGQLGSARGSAPCRPYNGGNSAAANANAGGVAGGALGPLNGVRMPYKPPGSPPDQENKPPSRGAAGGRGGGMGGGMGGGISSTLAAARLELDAGMPKPMRMAKPMLAPAMPRPSLLTPMAPGGAKPLGGIGHGAVAGALDDLDFEPLPASVANAPAEGARGKKAPSLEVNFDDDIDDEAMQAEEQAFLARMKAKGGGGGSAPPPSIASKAAPQDQAAPVVTPAAPASLAAGGMFDDFVDDLSDVEDL